MLTTSEIEQKTFSTALRGYDLDEVDDFLDQIVGTIKELNSQLEEARTASRDTPVEAIPMPEPAPDDVPELESEGVPQPEEVSELVPAAAESDTSVDEGAIGRVLIAAQTAADRLLEDAQTEAGRIKDDARGEVDSWAEERDAKKKEAESVISALATRVSSVRSELAVLAGEVSERLDDMDDVLEGSVDTDASEELADYESEKSFDDGVSPGDVDNEAE